ncbi:MAG: hypothetical protein AAF212_00720 [Verrucomicrobiota bacterium]
MNGSFARKFATLILASAALALGMYGQLIERDREDDSGSPFKDGYVPQLKSGTRLDLDTGRVVYRSEREREYTIGNGSSGATRLSETDFLLERYIRDLNERDASERLRSIQSFLNNYELLDRIPINPFGFTGSAIRRMYDSEDRLNRAIDDFGRHSLQGEGPSSRKEMEEFFILQKMRREAVDWGESFNQRY